MIPKEVISTTYDQFVNSSSIMWAMPGIERIFAMMIDISLSVIIFLVNSERKKIYLLCFSNINSCCNKFSGSSISSWCHKKYIYR